MNNSKVSVRYAKALLETALEKRADEQVRKDVALILDCLKSEGDFSLMLESPVIADSKKIEIFSAMFSSSFSPLTLDFFKILVKNKRENFLKIICMNYLTFYAKDKSIRQVTVTSATEQSDEVYSAVRQLVAKAFDNSAEVEMTKKIDSDIIGGLIIQIDDKVYDASIKTQLKKVKEKLK